MKKIALLILAVAIVAGSVIMYRAAAKPHANAVRIAESCTGLQCWPTVPVRAAAIGPHVAHARVVSARP